MINEDFNDACEKLQICTEKKIEIAKFLRTNNLSIHSLTKQDKDGRIISFIEIRHDFYEDGNPIILFSTEHRNDKSNLQNEDLLN